MVTHSFFSFHLFLSHRFSFPPNSPPFHSQLRTNVPGRSSAEVVPSEIDSCCEGEISHTQIFTAGPSVYLRSIVFQSYLVRIGVWTPLHTSWGSAFRGCKHLLRRYDYKKSPPPPFSTCLKRKSPKNPNDVFFRIYINPPFNPVMYIVNEPYQRWMSIVNGIRDVLTIPWQAVGSLNLRNNRTWQFCWWPFRMVSSRDPQRMIGDKKVTTAESPGNQFWEKSSMNHSGQIIIFHQPRFPWNKEISLTKPPFGVRSCEVAIIWPEVWTIDELPKLTR